jgi:hypothetical protein
MAQGYTTPTASAECLGLTMTTAIFDHLALAKPDSIVWAAPVGTIERFPVHFHAPRLRKHYANLEYVSTSWLDESIKENEGHYPSFLGKTKTYWELV